MTHIFISFFVFMFFNNVNAELIIDITFCSKVIDPEGVTKTVPPRGDGPEWLEGIMDFYRGMAGDDGKLEMMPNVLAPGGQSPYLGYKDGGLVTLFESK